VLDVEVVDADWYAFSDGDRLLITGEARAAEAAARRLLPLPGRVRLVVEASRVTLPATGDNAQTVAADLIRWQGNPARDVTTVTRAHLRKAFAHEAFHAARFRRLPEEAGATSWVHIAIREGLATVFARDTAAAHEPWAAYDPAVIADWAVDLFTQPCDGRTLGSYRFAHPDGREWIAFRVGTWLIDTVTARTATTAAALVWTPAADIAAHAPITHHHDHSTSG